MNNHPRFLLAHLLLRVAGAETASRLLPDAQFDGVFEAFVADIDQRPGCAPLGPDTGPEPPGAGFGFWVNAATTLDAERVVDPRPALRSVTTPTLVLRGACDYIAWEVTREYRDLLPNATLVGVPEAGHAIATDQPRRYEEIVLAYLLDRPLPVPPYDGQTPPARPSR